MIAFVLILLMQIPLGSTAPAPSALDQADLAFKNRNDPKQALQALALYRELYRGTEQVEKKSELSWRLAAACYFVGFRITEDASEKEKLFAEGRDAALECLKSSDRVECHFWAAINMALYGKEAGIFKMFFSLGTIREHLKKVIALDPTYMAAGAFRIEGKIEEALPGILGGSYDRAKEYYIQAISHGPNEPLNYLFLAILYKEQFDNPKEAIKIARQGLALPPPPPQQIESIEARDKLKKFLETELRLSSD